MTPTIAGSIVRALMYLEVYLEYTLIDAYLVSQRTMKYKFV